MHGHKNHKTEKKTVLSYAQKASDRALHDMGKAGSEMAVGTNFWKQAIEAQGGIHVPSYPSLSKVIMSVTLPK